MIKISPLSVELLNVTTSKCDVVNAAGILFLWYRAALKQFHEDGDSLSDVSCGPQKEKAARVSAGPPCKLFINRT